MERVTHFARVWLHADFRWIDPRDVPPPDGATSAAAPSGTPNSIVFHVADVSGEVALVSTQGAPLVFSESEEQTAAHLLRAGYRVVVWIGPQADGAGLAHCYSADADALERAAAAIWALKALGGWGQSPSMTFHLMLVDRVERRERSVVAHAREDAWMSARGALHEDSCSVEVTRARTGGWTALEEVLAHRSAGVVLAVVNDLRVYVDAYGHQEGDLVSARVHACIEQIALREGGTIHRVGTEGFAVITAPSSEAELAATIRREVRAMSIPFEHPTVRTRGCVTVSVGHASSEVAELRSVLEAGVDSDERETAIHSTREPIE